MEKIILLNEWKALQKDDNTRDEDIQKKKEEWEVAVLAHHTQQLNENIANYIIERKNICCSVTCKGCESCECMNDECINKDTCLGGCWVCTQCCEPCCENIACNDPARLRTHPWKPCEHCNEYCCGICEDCGLCCKGVCCEKCPCCGDRYHRRYNDFEFLQNFYN